MYPIEVKGHVTMINSELQIESCILQRSRVMEICFSATRVRPRVMYSIEVKSHENMF